MREQLNYTFFFSVSLAFLQRVIVLQLRNEILRKVKSQFIHFSAPAILWAGSFVEWLCS